MKITDPAAPALQGQDLQALVERLRERAGVGYLGQLLTEAADALAREHLRRQRAEEALRPFADHARFYAGAVDSYVPCNSVAGALGAHTVRVADFRLAASILNHQPEEPNNG